MRNKNSEQHLLKPMDYESDLQALRVVAPNQVEVDQENHMVAELPP